MDSLISLKNNWFTLKSCKKWFFFLFLQEKWLFQETHQSRKLIYKSTHSFPSPQIPKMQTYGLNCTLTHVLSYWWILLTRWQIELQPIPLSLILKIGILPMPSLYYLWYLKSIFLSLYSSICISFFLIIYPSTYLPKYPSSCN